MTHDRLQEPRSISRFDIEAGIRRAHKLRSEAVGNMFRGVFQRRHRAPETILERRCITC